MVLQIFTGTTNQEAIDFGRVPQFSETAHDFEEARRIMLWEKACNPDLDIYCEDESGNAFVLDESKKFVFMNQKTSSKPIRGPRF